MEKIKPCHNYDTAHLSYKGEPSYTCQYCLNRQAIDESIEKFVLLDGTVNCKNFNPEKRTIEHPLTVPTL